MEKINMWNIILRDYILFHTIFIFTCTSEGTLSLNRPWWFIICEIKSKLKTNASIQLLLKFSTFKSDSLQLSMGFHDFIINPFFTSEGISDAVNPKEFRGKLSFTGSRVDSAIIKDVFRSLQFNSPASWLFPLISVEWARGLRHCSWNIVSASFTIYNLQSMLNFSIGECDEAYAYSDEHWVTSNL